MSNRKETVIQFGEGGFLRGFVDYFFQKLKDQNLFDGSVVIVQPIEKGMCEMLEKQNCEYNLFLRGIDNGQVVDEHTHIDVISRCVNPYTDNAAYMALAENPDFRFIVSNTTEAGIQFVADNKFEDAPAKSFPGKLTQLLYKRFQLGLKGFIILSCELIDHNGEELEKCCEQYADLWNLGDEFKAWLKKENDFCSTLVDRIVTGFPRDEHAALCERIGEQDNMMDTAEIFHLWVIQGHHEDELPLQKAGFNVIWTDNVDPYKKRKVRILNGAHTSMVLGARLYGLETVGQCLKDEKVSALLKKCIFLNYCLHEELLSFEELPSVGQALSDGDVMSDTSLLLEETYQKKENEQHNQTYILEEQLLRLVRTGDYEGFKRFAYSESNFHTGVTGSTALRQLKNNIIITTTLCTRAAIEGGLDYDTAYQLSDYFIQSSERLTSADRLTDLLGKVSYTFAEKVAQSKTPSPE